MNIKKARQIVEEIANVVGQWDRFAKEAGVSATLTKKVKENQKKVLTARF